MSVADELKQVAINALNRLQERKARIQHEYDELEAQRVQKKVQLDAQVDAMSGARERLLNFHPASNGEFLCPHCWVVNGLRVALTPLPSGTDQDQFRCRSCHLELTI